VELIAKIVKDNLCEVEVQELIAIISPTTLCSPSPSKSSKNAKRRLKYKFKNMLRTPRDHCSVLFNNNDAGKVKEWDPRTVHPTAGNEVCEIVRRLGIFEKDKKITVAAGNLIINIFKVKLCVFNIYIFSFQVFSFMIYTLTAVSWMVTLVRRLSLLPPAQRMGLLQPVFQCRRCWRKLILFLFQLVLYHLLLRTTVLSLGLMFLSGNTVQELA
jgi:hypothetical protein